MGFLERFFKPDWGVHPDDHKRPAADMPLRVLPMPEKLFVSLQQHLGAPARPIIMVGQKVLKGQLLAEAQGNISAAIHAPTSGTIIAIGEISAPHPSGLAQMAITLAADGDDRWIDHEGVTDPFALTPAEIARRAALAGIVGLGGATFPAAVKLRLKAKTLLVNGGECEPYLSCDDRIMRDRPGAVVDGIRIVMHAIGATEARVGIENNKPEAIAAMREAATGFPDIRIMPIPALYPMGSEKHLIQTLMGKEVPAGARADEIGVLVHNVGTCAAVHRALRHGEPLVSRIITVNGGAVANPGNIVAPVGALVADVLAFAGLKETPSRLVLGGPMMGSLLPHALVPIVKGASGVLAFDAREAAATEAGPCIRCSSCVRVCPMGLLPMELAGHIRAGDLNGAVRFKLSDCIGCGCCAYVCPSHIPLVQYFNHAKGELAAGARTKLRTDATRRLAEQRTARLQREAVEKSAVAARRKAERDAAKARAAAEAAVPNEKPAIGTAASANTSAEVAP